MRFLRGSILIGSLLLMVRCSGPKVIAFTGGSPDFKSYYTYRVKHPGDKDKIDPDSEKLFERVENIIDEQMSSKGYENAAVADIVVSYNLILDTEVDYRLDRTSMYNYPIGYNPYRYPYWLERDEYTKGTLLIELREDLNRKLVWHASLDLKYNKRSSSRKKISPLENAFQVIFSKYPYIAGSDKIQAIENQ